MLYGLAMDKESREEANPMIKVASSLARELIRVIRVIRESGEVDIYDTHAVLEYAQKRDFVTVSRAIKAKPWWYLRCINEGIQACD